MTPITIKARVESDTLVIPGLAPFIGKDVEIRVSEEPASLLESMIDHEYHAELEAEFAADPSPIPSLEEVRAILAKLPGSLSADIIADREERF